MSKNKGEGMDPSKLEKALEHLKDIMPMLKDQFLFWSLMYVAQDNYKTSRFKLSNMIGTAVALKSINNTDFFTASAAKGYIAGQIALYEAKVIKKAVGGLEWPQLPTFEGLGEDWSPKIDQGPKGGVLP